ncbi:MAG: geranylgeranylglyceryl/heptaprenylglyceryl phosphate synthase [Flavobacteriales bacterium]|nr:geranylgeranylglyceryl/heptaprenylglyceryl phosphate synthase [Flavobacteriales bacterium]
MENNIKNILSKNIKNGKKMLAILIDPDKADLNHLNKILAPHNLPKIDLILVGGSVLTKGNIDEVLSHIKSLTDKPCILFPGSPDQINPKANAILLLALLSGRNPELLIGKHVESALRLKQSNLEIISTAYILIDGGNQTTVSYISGTTPIPADKPGLAALTALAGEQLGKHIIYMDAGSGAKNPITQEVISTVRDLTTLPIVVGGGIRTAEGIKTAWQAGADIVVIGNMLESNPEFLELI